MAKYAKNSLNTRINTPDTNPGMSTILAVKRGKVGSASAFGRNRDVGIEGWKQLKKNGCKKGRLEGGARLFHFVDVSLKVRKSDGQPVLGLSADSLRAKER